MKLSSLLSRFRKSRSDAGRDGAQEIHATRDAVPAKEKPAVVEGKAAESKSAEGKAAEAPPEEKGENGNGGIMTESIPETGSFETENGEGLAIEASVQTDVGRV